MLSPLTLELFNKNDSTLDKSSCDAFPAAKSQKEALEDTIQGESQLNRAYEIAVLTPQGKLASADFDKAYGATIAGKIRNMGYTRSSAVVTILKCT